MKLHTNKGLFKDAVIATAQKQGIKEIFVEKDYWVTLILKAVFENKIGEETVFKGGTALSKCNSLIKRFSEDIDLVVLRSNEETGSQLKKKLKTILKCVEDNISENEELLIRASNLWATGYSRLSKKEKSKRLKKFYAEDVEISFLKICNRYKLKEPLNWLLKIDEKVN